MKFRGVMTDAFAMKDFLNIINCLAKFTKDCVLRITQANLYFIIPDRDSGPTKPLAWTELPVNFYFNNDYIMEGVSDEHNEIYLEFSIVLLARSLAILKQNVAQVKMKLTNKDAPGLTLEIDLPPKEIQNRKFIYDIPIEILKVQHWQDYEEPQFNDFHVSIEMPNLRTIRNVVDRMKTMSHSLIVSASKSGRLTLRIKTNIVTLSSHFPNLDVRSFHVGDLKTLCNNTTVSDDEDESLQTVSSTVDIKKFLMYLSGMQLNQCKTTCSIIHEKMVKLSMEQAGVLSLQVFLTQLTL